MNCSTPSSPIKNSNVVPVCSGWYSNLLCSKYCTGYDLPSAAFRSANASELGRPKTSTPPRRREARGPRRAGAARAGGVEQGKGILAFTKWSRSDMIAGGCDQLIEGAVFGRASGDPITGTQARN